MQTLQWDRQVSGKFIIWYHFRKSVISLKAFVLLSACLIRLSSGEPRGTRHNRISPTYSLHEQWHIVNITVKFHSDECANVKQARSAHWQPPPHLHYISMRVQLLQHITHSPYMQFVNDWQALLMVYKLDKDLWMYKWKWLIHF